MGFDFGKVVVMSVVFFVLLILNFFFLKGNVFGIIIAAIVVFVIYSYMPSTEEITRIRDVIEVLPDIPEQYRDKYGMPDVRDFNMRTDIKIIPHKEGDKCLFKYRNQSDGASIKVGTPVYMGLDLDSNFKTRKDRPRSTPMIGLVIGTFMSEQEALRMLCPNKYVVNPETALRTVAKSYNIPEGDLRTSIVDEKTRRLEEGEEYVYN